MLKITLFVATLLIVSDACAQQAYPPDGSGEPLDAAAGYRPNYGQCIGTDGSAQPTIRYYCEGGFPRLFLHKDSKMSFVLSDPATDPATQRANRRLDMNLTGELAQLVEPVPHVVRGGVQNFYLPHCGAAGVVGVEGYNVLVYPDVYPHIDLVFYTTRSGQKMSFVVHPGANPSAIQMRFQGQDQMDVDVFGALKLWMQDKWILLPQATAYQYDQNNTITPLNWTAVYDPNVNTGVVGFAFSSYDNTKPLVLQIGPPPSGGAAFDEPGLCWSTYLGGTNWVESVYESTQDPAGNYYVTGYTNSDYLTFPVAQGFSLSQGGLVAFMLKFRPDDHIEWKDFFGGTPGVGKATLGTGIGFKDTGKIYMAGYTNSADLQNFQPGNEYYQGSTPYAGWKGFIGRFDTGTGAREWSTYFGTGYSVVSGLTISQNNQVFISGHCTVLLPPLDVAPPTGSTFWPSGGPLNDGFVAMFNENDQLAWKTFLPGSNVEYAGDITAKNGKIVVTGSTESTNMPGMSNSSHGARDCFVYEFTEGCVAAWGAYAGGTGDDSPGDNGLAIDPSTGDITLAGRTDGGLGIVPGPGWYQQYHAGTICGFIVRFSGIDHTVNWSTYLHGDEGSSLEIEAAAYDRTGNLFLAGEFTGTGLDLRQLNGVYYQSTINTDSQGNTLLRDRDAFVLSFTPSNYLPWCTYFGGNANSEVSSFSDPTAKYGSDCIRTILRRTYNNNIYVAGHTSKDQDFASYFPLDEGVGDPYFTAAWQGGMNECVVAAFCGDAITGMDGAVMQGTMLNVVVEAPGRLLLTGLPQGPQTYSLLDATGRELLTTTIRSNGSDPVRLDIPRVSTGTYVLRTAAGARSFLIH